jgi:hypothetical protein
MVNIVAQLRSERKRVAQQLGQVGRRTVGAVRGKAGRKRS